MANNKKTTGTSSRRKSTSNKKTTSTKKNTAKKNTSTKSSKAAGSKAKTDAKTVTGKAASTNAMNGAGAASKAGSRASSKAAGRGTSGGRAGANKAGTRGNGSKSAASRAARNGQQDQVLNRQDTGIPVGNDIKLIASFGLMLILMLSNFGLCGNVGHLLSSVFFGIFGCVQYVMPIAFFLGVWILIGNDYSELSLKKIGGGFVVLMMIAAFVQLMYQGESVQITDLFSVSARDHLAGGIIGGTIGILLRSGLGVIGAMIVIICVLLLALVVLTQRSLIEFFQNIWDSFMELIHAGSKEGDQGAYEEDEEGQLEMVFRDEDTGLTPEKGKKTRKDKNQSGLFSFAKKKDKEDPEEISAEELTRQQLEERVRFLEEERRQKAAKAARAQSEVHASEQKKRQSAEKEDSITIEKPKAKVDMPVFTASAKARKQGDVKELHMQPIPLSKDDFHMDSAQAELDFTAFSFNSGKSPEEFAEEVRAHARAFENHMKKFDSYQPPYRSKGAFIVPELKGSAQETSELSDSVIEIPKVEIEELEKEILVEVDKEQQKAEADRQAAREEEEKRQAARKEEPIPMVMPGMAKRPNRPESRMLNMNTAEKKRSVEEVKPIGASEISFIVDEKDTEGVKVDSIAPVKEKEGYVLPPSSLLKKSNQSFSNQFDSYLKETEALLEQTLRSFGVDVTMAGYTYGPAVTRYELIPGPGTKVSKIVNLTDDIKLSLAAADIRIEAPVPGKSVIGIEVPNKDVLKVYFRELIESPAFVNARSRTTFAVGKDIGGSIIVTDIASMPHLLIAGATGSGKSVCINTLIMSVLFKATPDEVKLIMVDPKKVELSEYNGIPHLLIPVVTDPKKAASALNWAIHEMDDRYEQFKQTKVRNIEGYNEKLSQLAAKGEIDPDKAKKMPHILIIIDELADLMMVSSNEVEDAIVRLSQLARAAGIHLVIATQRPSVNVITGLIKANVPSRIAFAVSSSIDSRTILDMNGAEKLLGKGDMLFAPQGIPKPIRVQGALISDEEVSSVVNFIKKQNPTSKEESRQTVEKIELQMKAEESSKDLDEYFEPAARFIMEKEKATIGMLQRMFKIGFNRAARIMDQLAEAGIVGPEEGTKPRKILMSPEQLEQFFEEYL